MNFGFRISDFGFKPLAQRTVSLRIQSAIRNPKSAMARSGFTFAEVLFAVIVLGIGFIMIAAVFPVAITQSKATKEETTAAAVVQQGVELLGQAGQWDAASWTWYGTTGPQPQDQPDHIGLRAWYDTPLPQTWYPFPLGGVYTEPTNKVFTSHRGDMKPISMRDFNPYVRKVAERLRSSRINPSDPRFAWVAFYRRDLTRSRNAAAPNDVLGWNDTPANFAQIIILGVQSQGEGHQIFNGDTSGAVGSDSDVAQGFVGTINNANWNPTNLDPRPIRVVIQKQPNDPVGTVIVSAIETGDPYFDSTRTAEYPNMVNAVAPGTFIIIGNDRISGGGPVNAYGDVLSRGRMNGRVYKVGAFIRTDAAGDHYELSPDGDFEPDAGEDGIAGNADDVLAVGKSNATYGSQISSLTVTSPAIAFVIGKPMVQRNDITKGFTGNTMDVSVYTTFIQVK